MNEPYDLVCVMPVYNEAVILERAVRLLVEWLPELWPGWRVVVVIANNGSTDRTAAVAERLANRLVGLIRHVEIATKGRGGALRQVVAQVPARRYLQIDADLPCELEDLALVGQALDRGADLVTSRRTGYRPRRRRLMTLGLRWLNRLVFGVRVADSQCAIKALSPRAAWVLAQDCRQLGWYVDTELVVLAHHRGLVVDEVPIRWIERRFPERRSQVKIGADSVAAARALAQIWRRRAGLKSELGK